MFWPRLLAVVRRIEQDGLSAVMSRRYRRLKKYWTTNNYAVGRLVELKGNQVNIHGVKISVDNPRISTRRKSLLFFGLYEKGEITAIHKYLRPDLPIIEVGGGIGVLSCIINKKLDNTNNHVVLEADPKLLPTLEKNMRLNQCDFTIEHGALAYGSEPLALHINEFPGSSLQVSGSPTIIVRPVSLEHLIGKYGFQSITLMADIEGSEAELIEHELHILKQNVKALFFELHLDKIGKSRWRNLEIKLYDAGFTLVDQIEKTYHFEHR